MITTMSLSFPSQLQGRDEEAEEDQVERPELEESDCREDEFDGIEVAVDGLNALDVGVEEDLVVVDDVVNLDVVGRPDLRGEDVELCEVDVDSAVLLHAGLGVEEVVDVEDEVVPIEGIQDDENVVI